MLYAVCVPFHWKDQNQLSLGHAPRTQDVFISGWWASKHLEFGHHLFQLVFIEFAEIFALHGNTIASENAASKRGKTRGY